MTLKYPGIGGRPIIVANVQCLLTGNTFPVLMLVDTGCDETCFPGDFAVDFGHDNDHPAVVRSEVNGVGGVSESYVHSVRVALIDPVKSTPKKHVIAWQSALTKCGFVKNLDFPVGLLGMDVMSAWRSVTFASTPKGPLITIEI